MARDAAAIRRVIWVTLVLNLLVALGKLAWGIASGVLSMTADGVHSLLDSANNVIGLIAVSAAAKPPDAGHPYGHRKFETFAALSIAALLLLACYEIVRTAAARALDPVAGDAGWTGYAVMLFTLGVNFGVAVYERREGERLGSEFLLADSAHTRSDVATSLSVIAALVAHSLGWNGVDLVATLFIVAWICRLAWQIVKPALATLADEARIDPRQVDDAAMAVAGVRDVHRIRTRGTPDAVFLDLHVQVVPHSTIEDAHAVANEVERVLLARFPEVVDVVVHLEPHGDPVEGLDGQIVGPPR
jgi:cation diffusion facilitator family transporter